jgi:hypothetical protein
MTGSDQLVDIKFMVPKALIAESCYRVSVAFEVVHGINADRRAVF